MLVSIPRDTIVERSRPASGATAPVCRPSRRRCSTRRSPRPAPACTIKTVEKLTKIRIDHYVVIDFGGFKDMVERAGRGQDLPAAGGDRPAVAPVPHQGRARREGRAGAGLRPHPARARQRQRHRAHRPPAGVPRLDGQEDQEQGPAAATGPAAAASWAPPPTRSAPTPDSAASTRCASWPRTSRASTPRTSRSSPRPTSRRPHDPNRVELKPSAGPCGTRCAIDQPLPGKGPTPTASASATPSGPPLEDPAGEDVGAGAQRLGHQG